MDTITIPVQEYNDLLEDSKTLDALFAGGVDNWEGYDYAVGCMEDN